MATENKTYGPSKKAVVGNKRKAFMGNHNSYGRYVCLCLIPLLSGCAVLKKTALVAGASSIGAGVGSVLSGSVGAFVGAATGATAGVLVTGLPEETLLQGTEIVADTVVSQAPTNIWDVVSQLGLWTGLIILIPLVLGILLPGPVQFKGKSGKQINPNK